MYAAALSRFSGWSLSRGEMRVRVSTCCRRWPGLAASPCAAGSGRKVGWVTAAAARPRRIANDAAAAVRTRRRLRDKGLISHLLRSAAAGHPRPFFLRALRFELQTRAGLEQTRRGLEETWPGQFRPAEVCGKPPRACRKPGQVCGKPAEVCRRPVEVCRGPAEIRADLARSAADPRGPEGRGDGEPRSSWDTLPPEPLLPWRPLIVRAFLSWSVLAVCLALEALVVHKIGFAAVAGMTRQERLDELFSDFAREAPGLAVGVARNGQVLFQAGYGLADLDRQTRIDPDTAFHIASCGKQMTAAAVLMLVEEGKLDLDRPAARYLPEMRGWGRKVTIRQLLHHTAGIPDTYEALKERGGVPTGTDALRLLARWHRLDSSPGTQFAYSDSGYDILGTLIHRVSGRTYPRFLEERIFRPAGMKDTFVYERERLKT